MKNRKKLYLILILVVLSQKNIAQHSDFKIPDSLNNKDYSYFSNGVLVNKKQKHKAILYAKSWLSKSKSEQNWNQMALAYKAIMYNADKAQLLSYSDSVLVAAKKSKDVALIGTAYLTKGIVYYDRKEHTKALDNYLIADKYISQTDDSYAIHKVKYAIAQTKYYLGFYHEAIALLKECIKYYESENDRAYLNSIHSLGLCYNKVNNYKLSSYYNKLGLEESKKLENSEMDVYFNHSEGINHYFKKEYTQAIATLNKILPGLKNKNDFANEAVANFYIGKSYWDLKQYNRALPFLLKVDKIFVEEKYTRPDLRENFELLIDFYKNQNNIALELVYTKRLTEVDIILIKNYKYLSRKIFKVYDTKKLQLHNLELEKSTGSKNQIIYILTVLFSTIIAFLAIRHYRSKKYYRQKFEELMESSTDTKKATSINYSNVNEGLDINPEVIAMILKNLEKFEKNRKYLEKDMNLSRLAALLNTNSKYAGKVIHKYRGQKIIDYISDLKLNHIITLLKNENKYRLYTNEALGEEAGFSSTQNFTRAFKKHTKISPTYFIQELQKPI
ncbi:helix-turn-helix domain-containing protein [Flavobacterium sp. 120]|uniref:helix-turn-helix domain-containing protein n=1 Tax=Flavobacterium sp. 120 TaxID=2135626 RepID=UPI000EAC3A8D|nr:helix-turn-helix domain-containing protein [Flavobacterium sp. 120]RKS14301.1 helix-turn-helix protein [Flavobacterium sp. 120]